MGVQAPKPRPEKKVKAELGDEKGNGEPRVRGTSRVFIYDYQRTMSSEQDVGKNDNDSMQHGYGCRDRGIGKPALKFPF